MPTPHLDAVALLTADHRTVEDLFAKFEAANGAATKQALAARSATGWPPKSSS